MQLMELIMYVCVIHHMNWQPIKSMNHIIMLPT
jgi:hypothetical protein